MNKRITLIMLITIAALLVIGLVAVSSAALAYTALKVQPAIALALDESVPDRDLGILVAGIEPGSPAESVGIMRGDILLEINGEEVNDTIDLIQILEDLKSAEQVELTVLHGEDIRSLTATLDDRSDRSYLGIKPCGISPSRVPVVGLQEFNGIIVTEVIPDSPADHAGLTEGERILSVDGKELGGDSDLAGIIGDYEPGDTINLEITSPDDDIHQVSITLGEYPDDPDKAYLGVYYFPAPSFRRYESGRIPFDTPNRPLPDLPFMHPFELPEGDMHGAIITEVISGSPADEAGLQKGDIITTIDNEEIDDPDALAKSIQAHKEGDKIVLTIYRPGESESIKVQATLGDHPEKANKAFLGIKAAHFIKAFKNDDGIQLEDLPFFQDLPHFEDLPFLEEFFSEQSPTKRFLPHRDT